MRRAEPYLQSVVVGVGDNHPVGVAHGDVMGMLQLSGFAAHTAKLCHKCAVTLEHLDEGGGLLVMVVMVVVQVVINSGGSSVVVVVVVEDSGVHKNI